MKGCISFIFVFLQMKSFVLTNKPIQNEQITFLRTLVQKSFDISPRQQCLINEGVIMEDGKTVKDYNIENGAQIDLIIK